MSRATQLGEQEFTFSFAAEPSHCCTVDDAVAVAAAAAATHAAHAVDCRHCHCSQRTMTKMFAGQSDAC